ncbi:Flp family type IVb pilin [Brevundimonas variabilis]|uniref:Pilus assembly protein Flp/PilA n=1 Tax=Brevundimonas variabilis TaxID=74312 RepID=A0A7W9FCZ3_9CAUL|nr:Flp family type IVb pilin [Brevundimonas variabilis]MBB5744926.1 pilus assembly protein Flp/PilA [Brevundimonas variabilis]
MFKLFVRLIDDERGATAIEYGLIIALMAVVILTALTAFSNTSTGVFNAAMASIAAAMGGGS